MHADRSNPPKRFRVWITEFEDWHPLGWHEVPPFAQAIEPAEDTIFTSEQAAAYLEGFNTASLAEGAWRWAVAVPVAPRWLGDLQPGQTLVEGFACPIAKPGPG